MTILYKIPIFLSINQWNLKGPENLYNFHHRQVFQHRDCFKSFTKSAKKDNFFNYRQMVSTIDRFYCTAL